MPVVPYWDERTAADGTVVLLPQWRAATVRRPRAELGRHDDTDGVTQTEAVGVEPVRHAVTLDDARWTTYGVWRSGSAPALGAGGREFKSPHPDQSDQV